MFLHNRFAHPATALLVVVFAVALFALPATSLSTGSPEVSSERQVNPGETSSSAGLLFVENAGQWPEAARFQVWGSPAGVGTTWLAEDAIWVVVGPGGRVTGWQGDKANADNPVVTQSPGHPVTRSSQIALKLTFPGSNPDVRIDPLDPLTTNVSYFLGDDPAQWRPDVPVYSGVRYADLYPGVNLVLGASDAFWQLESLPNADTSAVRLRIEGAKNLALADRVAHITTAAGILALPLPGANFAMHVEGTDMDGQPLVLNATSGAGDALGLRVARSHAPTDDPADLLYSTFLGGSDMEHSWECSVALDSSGRAYVTSDTYSSDLPTTPGVFDPSISGSEDAFVVRLNAAGSALDYATFLGGDGQECNGKCAVAVDSSDRAVVTSWTSSSNFPTTPGAFDTSLSGNSDAFVVRLNDTGTALDYATFLGGGSVDGGTSLALDSSGRATVTGYTASGDFPTTPSALDLSYNGGNSDAFVVRLDAAGSALDYATFLGGSDSDPGTDLALDSSGRATVTGWTRSSDFPTTPGAFDTSYNGESDAYVVRLNAEGSVLDYATFLGGGGGDHGWSLALDSNGGTTVTGLAGSSDFPTTPGAFDTENNGSQDAFVARLAGDGSALVYSTFLGGSDDDYAYDVALDDTSRATVAGRTRSGDFPTAGAAFDLSFNGHEDTFAVRLNTAGSALEYATFLGGSDTDVGTSLALDSGGRAYVAGGTSSDDFPTTPGAFDTSYNARGDVFVTKLDMYFPNAVSPIEQPYAGSLLSGTVTLRGFAIDLGSAAGTGVDRVQVYLDGPSGAGTLIGDATYGLARPDVAAQFGVRFGPSGWELAWDTNTITPGVHRLYLSAHRTMDNRWSQMPPHLVVVRADHVYWLILVFRNQ